MIASLLLKLVKNRFSYILCNHAKLVDIFICTYILLNNCDVGLSILAFIVRQVINNVHKDLICIMCPRIDEVCYK